MKKRFLSILLSLCMALSLLPGTAMAEDSISGKCGPDATWKLTESGTLTISGSGTMDDYRYKKSPWTNNGALIKKVVIEKGITDIGGFQNLKNLTSVTIPSGVKSINPYAFEKCSSLTSITLPSTITEIGYNAFCECENLTKVQLPSNLEWIGERAFYRCSKLSSMTIPAKTKKIYSHAFSGCSGLKQVTIPASVETIGEYGFWGCTSLQSISIPGSVTSIGQYAFAQCTALQRASISDGVVKIGIGAFESCTNLLSIIIPDTVTDLGMEAFQNCYKLADVTLSSGLTKIEYGTFSGSGVKTLVVPTSVQLFGIYSFNRCPISDIYYAGSTLEWNNISLPWDMKLNGVNIHYNSTGPVRQFAVIFDANGGTMTGDDTKIVTSGKTYGTLPTPKRSGYTFKGWYTAKSGGTKITSSSKVDLSGDQFLYAQWTKASTSTTKYTIKFDANGGTVSKKSITVNKNAPYGELPVPTRSGYTFSGWYTSKSSGTKVSETTKATANRTLYARWTKASATKVTITLNANGGSVSPKSLRVDKNALYYDELPVPTRDGYIFDGWYTTKTGGTEVTETTKAAFSRTIYAHWTEDEVPADEITVYFDANGGEVSQEEMPVVIGESYGEMPVPVRTGYTFSGWYTAETGGKKVTSSTTVTQNEDHVLYARWTKASAAKVTITLNANGGSVSPKSLRVDKNAVYYDELPTPTRSGYTFKGWYTTSTGSTKITAATKATASRTIYAQWTKTAGQTRTITLNANGGSVSPASVKVTGTYGELPTPIRDGYFFDGWFTQRVGGTEITPETKATVNRTIYAHWTEASGSGIQETARKLGLLKYSSTANFSKNLTRLELAEVVVALARIPLSADAELNYTDCGDLSSQQKMVLAAFSQLASAYSDNTFRPNSGVMRSESAAIIKRAMEYRGKSFDGTDLTRIPAYSDVPSSVWYYDAVMSLAAVGVLPSSGKFSPAANIQGNDILEWIVKAEQYLQNASDLTPACTITLNANGGSVSPASLRVDKNAAYFDELPAPARSGYIFSGWYTARTGGTKITSATKATADRTIYAHWTKAVSSWSGTCGPNVTWKLSESGTLTITGSGAMENYFGSAPAPWAPYRGRIKTAVVNKGVTEIGSCSFAHCENLTKVTIPSSVTKIGNAALFNCTNLADITIPAGVKWMGNEVFWGCTKLSQITIPYGVSEIEHSAFKGCTNLASVTLPGSISYLGDNMFENCGQLTDIYYGGSQHEWNKIASNLDLKSNVTIHFSSSGTGPSKQPYTVSFNPNGGRVYLGSKQVVSGDTYQA